MCPGVTEDPDRLGEPAVRGAARWTAEGEPRRRGVRTHSFCSDAGEVLSWR